MLLLVLCALLCSTSLAIFCPQLPIIEPKGLAGDYDGLNYRFDNLPPGWSCAADKYYQIKQNATYVSCDCGCGAIDPDCGFLIENCFQQIWEPVYDEITCDGNMQAKDLFYCRLESFSCQILPPGLSRAKGISEAWDCIPDVYNELSDPLTSLNDCDCNCGGFDPDCLGAYNDIYCSDYISADGSFLPRTWANGPFCLMDQYGTYCETIENPNRLSDGSLFCPQLPTLAPWQIVVPSYGYGNPPPGWLCDRFEYYDGSTCDCECGLIDPDCGYELRSCSDQTWNPEYTTIKCGGVETYVDYVYCRIESATCTALPVGLSRDTAVTWDCIPDVYNELSDPGTSLNDCDCNCNSLDADCFGSFNDIYCLELLDSSGAPIANPASSGISCEVLADGVGCIIPLVTDEHITPMSLQIIVSVLVALTDFWLMWLAYFTNTYKTTPLIKATSPLFCYILLFGAFVLNTSSILFVIPSNQGPADLVCSLRVWLISCSVTMFVSPLLVKIYRLTQIFQQKLKAVYLPDSEILKAFCLLVFVMMCINLIFMVMSPFTYLESRSYTMNANVDYTILHECAQNSLHLLFCCLDIGGLCLWGAVLAYRSRNMPSKFNETLPLLIVLGFIVVYGLLIVPLQFMLASSPNEVSVLRSVGCVLGVFICINAIYLPKLLAIYDDPANGASTSNGSNNSTGKNNSAGKKRGKKKVKVVPRSNGTSKPDTHTRTNTSNTSNVSGGQEPENEYDHDDIPLEYTEEHYEYEEEEVEYIEEEDSKNIAV